MVDVSAPMSVSRSLVVTVMGLEPGAPIDTAVRLADALDARRVPLTLLADARPHPEVAAWAAARRRAGDGVLLHGAGRAGHPSTMRRLPAHEAGLRLAGALRARDGVGLELDGFAAPGWAVSGGVRAALASAGIDLLVDDTGVHRLGADGSVRVSVAGPVVDPRAEAASAGRRLPRRPRRRAGTVLRHHAVTLGSGSVDAVLRAVDADLAAGAVPDTAPGLLTPHRPVPRARELGDPEFWSITA